MNNTYIFSSERLGFRNWMESDIVKMAEINAKPEVMEFFPNIQTYENTVAFVERMQQLFASTGFCYFAVDTLDDKELIGFIGLAEQDFKSEFTPFIDIGWRLDTTAWNKGYATEGAKACLKYGFSILKLEKIYSFTPSINIKSEQVMKKIGMKKITYFDFPLFVNDARLKECVLYEIENKLY